MEEISFWSSEFRPELLSIIKRSLCHCEISYVLLMASDLLGSAASRLPRIPVYLVCFCSISCQVTSQQWLSDCCRSGTILWWIYQKVIDEQGGPAVWSASYPGNVCFLLGFEFLNQLDWELLFPAAQSASLDFPGAFHVIIQWQRATLVVFTRVRHMAYSYQLR